MRDAERLRYLERCAAAQPTWPRAARTLRAAVRVFELSRRRPALRAASHLGFMHQTQRVGCCYTPRYPRPFVCRCSGSARGRRRKAVEVVPRLRSVATSWVGCCYTSHYPRPFISRCWASTKGRQRKAVGVVPRLLIRYMPPLSTGRGAHDPRAFVCRCSGLDEGAVTEGGGCCSTPAHPPHTTPTEGGGALFG